MYFYEQQAAQLRTAQTFVHSEPQPDALHCPSCMSELTDNDIVYIGNNHIFARCRRCAKVDEQGHLIDLHGEIIELDGFFKEVFAEWL